MKIKTAFSFIFVIFLLITIFIGLPYLLVKLRSIGFGSFKLPSINLPSGNYFRNVIGGAPVGAPPSPSIGIGDSLYKGKIRISSVSQSEPQQISLSAGFAGNGSINITGWRVKSVQDGYETVIGRGVALPQFNVVSGDIRLSSGDSAQITAAASPLLSNFRVNNCFGWLSNLYNLGFNYCPSFGLPDFKGAGLDTACEDLILSSGACRAPGDDILNGYRSNCRVWVEKNMNYNACVSKHLNDSGFYQSWQIYTGNNNIIFDTRHDRIELRDQANQLVDYYEY